jgi:hypothetical protein
MPAPWEEEVIAALGRIGRDEVTVPEVCAEILGVPADRLDSVVQVDVARMMIAVGRVLVFRGWSQHRPRRRGGPEGGLHLRPRLYRRSRQPSQREHFYPYRGFAVQSMDEFASAIAYALL